MTTALLIAMLALQCWVLWRLESVLKRSPTLTPEPHESPPESEGLGVDLESPVPPSFSGPQWHTPLPRTGPDAFADRRHR